MTYQKPVVVAQAEAKKSYVAGCATNTPSLGCNPSNIRCMSGSLK